MAALVMEAMGLARRISARQGSAAQGAVSGVCLGVLCRCLIGVVVVHLGGVFGDL